MIKETVEAFTLGLMAIDMRDLVQKSSAAHSWVWSTHQTSWVIIIYERVMGEFKDDKLEGKGTKYYVNGKKEAGTWKNWIFLG